VQLIHLSTNWMIACFFVLWPILQFAAFLSSSMIVDRFLTVNSIIFKPFRWEEQGEIYNRLFMIHRWKRYLPDGAIGKRSFKKKKLESKSGDHLERFLVESCRAELSHWFAITPFWIFGFFAPIRVVPYMLLYALVVNIPCIMAQRYNRPRTIRVLKKMDHSSVK
jgi:glycosyl-4,4'-diaponeurosporenoate acyltransferase